jgi:hypothetical protein
VPSRVFVLFLIAICSLPASANAEWLLSPYLGARFAAGTTIIGGREGAENNKFTFGSSIGLLTAGVLGLEADVGFVPRFFESEFVRSGSVTTVMGNVIVALPVQVAQYGLRPYATGGVGLMHAGGAQELLGTFIDSNLFGMNVGGGALGPISPRSSLRFDLRYFRNIGGGTGAATADAAGLELSFWRGTVGLTFRF